MQHMHGSILYLLDFRADPVVHLLLLGSSIAYVYPKTLCISKCRALDSLKKEIYENLQLDSQTT